MFLQVRDEIQTGNLAIDGAKNFGRFEDLLPAHRAVGVGSASAALQRLNRFQASNRFYAANRELGRALKTEFVLQYMSEPKVRRGLLKVEQLHALARAVYYGQRGRISALGRRAVLAMISGWKEVRRGMSGRSWRGGGSRRQGLGLVRSRSRLPELIVDGGPAAVSAAVPSAECARVA